MKITRISTHALHHPLPRGTGPSTYYYHSRNTLIIRIETDAGLVGWGETSAFGGLRSLIEDVYAPVLIGRDPLEHRAQYRQVVLT